MIAINPLHATSVVIDGRVLLLAGASGSGKSDLALRLIDRGGVLLSDDYTQLRAEGGLLLASAPSTIEGRLEIRGLGIYQFQHQAVAPVALMLDLDRPPLRLPDDPAPKTMLCGIAIPTIAFSAFECSAAIKAELALRKHGLIVER